MVMNNSRLIINHVANGFGTSRESVENFLHSELGMTEVSARWVPYLLTRDQKCTRLIISRENMKLFEADLAGFLEHRITQDECWIHDFEPETNKLFNQWEHSSPTALKKTSSFWDARSSVFNDYLESGHTINGEHYANILR
ncbi:uncharacterized protein LOC106878909 [Octopus bimaculoides]|uniref:uncharacterized protein LOC106878909 n=1 Tax=Octopus bimaculoides TaxID=37653 RepID=UPI00071D316A|nr:uncharacterized protein LOC106878909 [Octopus bimaculoides]|eukprot:XP_014783743.1 PREDICTED: uncharacterized protein LOC106878909 [Octopus bimaculoides]